MTTDLVDVADVPALEHEEAMALAGTEYERLLQLVDALAPDDWSQPTDCTGWDVKAVLSHLLGFMKVTADPAEGARQAAIASRTAEEQGISRLDAQTALHVREHAHLSPQEIAAALHEWAGRALAGRAGTTPEQRQAPYPTGFPGEGVWTRGYLLDVVLTRDQWMHRVDLCRATARQMILTPDHDGRIVADVVADWARRHDRPVTLYLDGPVGGGFSAGGGGTKFQLDAVEFCRVLSGRDCAAVPATGLLTTFVPF